MCIINYYWFDVIGLVRELCSINIMVFFLFCVLIYRKDILLVKG